MPTGLRPTSARRAPTVFPIIRHRGHRSRRNCVVTAAGAAGEARARAVSIGYRYQASQPAKAALTSSGRSMVERCPQRSTTTSREPAIPAAISSAPASGVAASSRPQTTRVGQRIVPSVGRLSARAATIPDSEKFSRLRQLAFFRAFSDVELWEVMSITNWHRYPKDSMLIREGEVGTSFFVLAAGPVLADPVVLAPAEVEIA